MENDVSHEVLHPSKQARTKFFFQLRKGESMYHRIDISRLVGLSARSTVLPVIAELIQDTFGLVRETGDVYL